MAKLAIANLLDQSHPKVDKDDILSVDLQGPWYSYLSIGIQQSVSLENMISPERTFAKQGIAYRALPELSMGDSQAV